MTDRPIIMSAPMVRALLEGRKTQMRRVLRLPTKGIYERKDMGGWAATINGGGGCFTIARDGTRVSVPETIGIWHQTTGRCLDTPWQKGDRLWVREAWRGHSIYEALSPRDYPKGTTVFFEADQKYSPSNTRLRPSIHMPRWASRITLLVTDVRVQRLQDISEEDAKAEGIACLPLQDPDDPTAWWQSSPGFQQARTPGGAYRLLWNSLHGDKAWSANPWVAALTFRPILANIDAPEASS